eukprot:1158980-Pelagomonas_calceolata.AAC.5
MGVWRVTGSTRLQNLAVRSVFVFDGTSSGNKFVGIFRLYGFYSFVGIFDRMSMQFASPTNTQKYGVESHSFCIDKIAELVRLSRAVSNAGPLCHITSAA